MAKSDIREKLITTLKKARFGLNVSQLSEQLGLHRNTIPKYLDALEKDGIIVDREVGQYHIWLHKDVLAGNYADSSPFATIMFTLYKSLMKNISGDITPSRMKEIGKSMATEINFEDLLNINTLDSIILSGEMPGLRNIAQIFMQLIDNACKMYDTYSWRSPIILDEKGVFILQMADSELVSSAPYHYYMISGFIEAEIHKFLKGSVDVIDIILSERVVQFKFEIPLQSFSLSSIFKKKVK